MFFKKHLKFRKWYEISLEIIGLLNFPGYKMAHMDSLGIIENADFLMKIDSFDLILDIKVRI